MSLYSIVFASKVFNSGQPSGLKSVSEQRSRLSGRLDPINVSIDCKDAFGSTLTHICPYFHFLLLIITQFQNIIIITVKQFLSENNFLRTSLFSLNFRRICDSSQTNEMNIALKARLLAKNAIPCHTMPYNAIECHFNWFGEQTLRAEVCNSLLFRQSSAQLLNTSEAVKSTTLLQTESFAGVVQWRAKRANEEPTRVPVNPDGSRIVNMMYCTVRSKANSQQSTTECRL